MVDSPDAPQGAETLPGPAVPAGRVALIMGFFAAAMAVWVLPFVFGVIALVFGAVALSKGERRGWWVVAAAFVGTGLGLVVELLPEKLVGG